MKSSSCRKGKQMRGKPQEHLQRPPVCTLKGRFSLKHLTKLAEALNSALSAYLPINLRNAEVGTIDPHSMLDSDCTPHEFACAYQMQALLKKCPTGNTSDKQKQDAVALAKFIDAETRCRSFNQGGFRTLTWPEDDSTLLNLLNLARREIERVIGSELPSLSSLTLSARPGPGATFIPLPKHLKGATTVYYKLNLGEHLAVSYKALPFAVYLIQQDKRWLRALEETYRSFLYFESGPLPLNWLMSLIRIEDDVNKVVFIPKNENESRGIAIELGLNVQLQLGVDGYIRSQLKPFGVNLDSQVHNQNLARDGVLRGLSTLDLRSASDGVSLELCKLLLPPEWFEYLCLLRSSKGTLPDGTIVEYEKISSMGNGYTFALESLIFYAITKAAALCCGHRLKKSEFAIYGDDIIVPQDLALITIEALNACGFSVNTDKTFIAGRFRESCGADYVDGIDVRPIFIKDLPEYVDDLYGIYNRLRGWLVNHLYLDDEEVFEILKPILLSIPDEELCWGPALNEPVSTHLYTSDERKLVTRKGQYKFTRVLRRSRDFGNENYGWFRRLIMTQLKPGQVNPLLAQLSAKEVMPDVTSGVVKDKINLESMILLYKSGVIDFDELCSGTPNSAFRITHRSNSQERTFDVVRQKSTVPLWTV